MSATDVFERLIGKIAKPAQQELSITVAGKKVATLRTDPKGRAVVEFEGGALLAEKHAALAKLIEDFMS